MSEIDHQKLDDHITALPKCDECGSEDECYDHCRCESCRERAFDRENDARNDMD